MLGLRYFHGRDLRVKEAGEDVRFGEDAFVIERAGLLNKSIWIAGAANLLNSFLVAAFLWSDGPRPAIFLWFTALAAVTLTRAILLKTQGPALNVETAQRHNRRTTLLSGAAGVFWGVSSSFMAHAQPAEQSLILFMIAGMTAASISSNSAHAKAAATFIFPALIPFILYFLTQGQIQSAVMGMVASIYLVFCLRLALNTENTIRTAHGLKMKQEELYGLIQKREQEADDEAQRFRAIIEETLESILCFDAGGHVTYANPAACRVLGLSPGEIEGLKLHRLLDQRDNAIFEAASDQAFEAPGEAISISHFRIRGKGGALKRLSGRITNLRHAPGVVGFVFQGVEAPEDADAQAG